jgi:hypothetical protein
VCAYVSEREREADGQFFNSLLAFVTALPLAQTTSGRIGSRRQAKQNSAADILICTADQKKILVLKRRSEKKLLILSYPIFVWIMRNRKSHAIVILNFQFSRKQMEQSTRGSVL